MSTAYEEVGRVRQKRRTREALITAARRLIADGVTPNVEVAAEHAGVSRTTAYRYFPNQASLLAAAHPEIITTTLLPTPAPTDVAERLEIVVSRVTELVVDTEAQQRTMLRLSLEAGSGHRELLLRQGRVIGWLEDALAPLTDALDRDSVRQLAIAIRSTIGIESYVWLTDVAGLSPFDAVETMRWTARSLLDSARRGSLPTTAHHRERHSQQPTRHRDTPEPSLPDPARGSMTSTGASSEESGGSAVEGLVDPAAGPVAPVDT